MDEDELRRHIHHQQKLLDEVLAANERLLKMCEWYQFVNDTIINHPNDWPHRVAKALPPDRRAIWNLDFITDALGEI